MKVLIVCNNAFTRGNGLHTALLSLLKHLKEAGVQVRLLSVENENPGGPQPDYPLKHFKIPVFEYLIASNGFRFGEIDEDTLVRAVIWADILHIMEAFPLEARIIDIAERYGKPCVATYHIFPHNVIAGAVHGGVDNPLNDILEWFWKKSVFNRCTYIHCPTEIVKRHLSESGYTASLEVFSNGIDIPESQIEASHGIETPPSETRRIDILCIGRLAFEKSQETLLEAMRYSRHSREIHLHFAGKGPMEKRYRRQAERLVRNGIVRHEPEFGFYDRADLDELIRRSYLYIHCAWAEVEGLSCLEAIRGGLVPLIADSPMSATSQFALDERSLFPAGNPQALATKIDWWIEHPRERKGMGKVYADSARKYDVTLSTNSMLRMYRKALDKVDVRP